MPVKSDAALPSLSHEEIARYSRHLIMPEVGLEGQRKLKAASVLMIRGAADPATSPELQAGFLLVVALLALAILEHWFLVVPLPSLVLFRWGLASRAAGRGVDVREVAARRLVVVPSAVPSHRRAP